MEPPAGPPPAEEGPPPPEVPGEEEEDPLLVAQRAAEQLDDDEGVQAELESIDYSNADELLKEFFAEVREVDRDNEVNRILGAFKLNPYEQLGVRFDVLAEEITRHYRRTSLLVHPDKCRHPRAKDAFDVLRQAQQALLQEARKRELDFQLSTVRDMLREERRKATKNDAAVRMAAMAHEEGRAGVEAAWEASDEFHALWQAKSRDVLAKSEWRKRKLTKRLKEETLRVEDEEKDERDRLKAARHHEKGWEKSREGRVGTWRDFQKKSHGSSKEGKKKKAALGGLRPPKAKTFDDDKTYVQRPVGEQFRPPPMVAPKPQRKGD